MRPRLEFVSSSFLYFIFNYFRYEFKKEGEKAALLELGPRFTLRLKWVQKGTFDAKWGEFEWVIKVELSFKFLSKLQRLIILYEKFALKYLGILRKIAPIFERVTKYASLKCPAFRIILFMFDQPKGSFRELISKKMLSVNSIARTIESAQFVVNCKCGRF